MKRTLLFVLALVTSLGLSRIAAADVPDFSFFPECLEEINHQCPQCVKYGDADNDPHSYYQKCVDDATAKGMVKACHRNLGAKLIDFYCPKDVIAQRDAARSRGSSGCSMADGTPSAGLMGVAIGALGLRRRRGRRASSQPVIQTV